MKYRAIIQYENGFYVEKNGDAELEEIKTEVEQYLQAKEDDVKEFIAEKEKETPTAVMEV